MTRRSDDDHPPSPPPHHGELDDLFAIVDRLPFFGSLKKDLTHLRKLLYDRRTPRVLAVGARGSGRTSLANSLLRLPALPLGEHAASPPDAWIRIDAGGRHLDWLEVASGPLEGGRLAMVRRALDESVPDVIVVAARADAPETEGAAARETLAQIHTMLAESKTIGDAKAARPATIGVITHVDRVTEPEAAESGVRFATEDLARLDAATLALKKQLEAGTTTKITRPIPVLAGGELGGPDQPVRWNVEEVAAAIHDALADEAKVEAVRALAVPVEMRRELARTIVNHCAAAAVTVGLMPVPFSDAVILLPLQGVMVSGVAYLAGQPWDRRAALEWLGSVGVMGGAAFGLRWGAQQLVKLIPGAGTLVSGSVAGAGTLAIGRSAVAYFVDGPGARTPRLQLPADASTPIETPPPTE
ncbi:YcjF family protein [Sandaracinus amylolyticus]|uniref:G domain-containing protein n=1 Tax=Sandaracinus amylolyticus TaxID=927083 RepID=A0A0F6YM77_9BACT|nr:DUF697 domain-containing protein [Sandaracinus amylolyticus]AKF09995.1 hypothetical protein DB32_007144 [Sandaracinus amylolyticus]